MIREYPVNNTGVNNPSDVAASVRISGVPERWLRHAREAATLRSEGDGKEGQVTAVDMKPEQFHVPCVTVGQVSYSCCDEQLNSTFSGGVLPVGKRVWTATRRGVGSDRTMVAFVEGVGTVRTDGRTLRLNDEH
jgi:hypothetical protein